MPFAPPDGIPRRCCGPGQIALRMAQRLLALDLDGTTLNHMGELSPAVRDAIAALPEEVAVVVATGRSIIATTPVLEALGLRPATPSAPTAP